MQGLLKRLQQNPELLREQNAIISDQLAKGIVAEVGNTEAVPNTTHYLLHLGVIDHDIDTTEVRVVNDASAGSSSPSLNDCLHTGPKFE